MTASGIDGIVVKNSSSSSAVTVLQGGRYALDAHSASWSSGSVALQRVAGDGSTLVDILGVYEKADGTGGTAVTHKIAALTADGLLVFDIPAGRYQITVTTATVYARVSRVPL